MMKSSFLHVLDQQLIFNFVVILLYEGIRAHWHVDDTHWRRRETTVILSAPTKTLEKILLLFLSNHYYTSNPCIQLLQSS